MIRRRNSCLLLLSAMTFILVSGVAAQDFKMKASLDTVKATGFYKIPVVPELTAIARSDFADIRISDDKGGFAPYITRASDRVHNGHQQMSNLEITGITSERNFSTIILELPARQNTCGIALEINNTTVERYASVSGSADKEKWYIIDDHVLLSRASGNNKGAYTQEINFPVTNYNYFKLKINNAHTDPLNVIGAKAFYTTETVVQLPNFVENPAPVITQKDSNNHISYVTVRHTAPYLVNQVRLSVTGTKFYERNVTVFIRSGDSSSGAQMYPAGSFTLSSNHQPATFTIAGEKAKIILLEIDNKDNPPLKIMGATTLQENQSLIAWLEQGKKYTLLTGSETATHPSYDLSRFTDSIPSQLPVLKYGKFSVVSKAPVTATKPETGNYWIWVVVIAAVGVLSLLTFRLLSDVKKGEG